MSRAQSLPVPSTRNLNGRRRTYGLWLLALLTGGLLWRTVRYLLCCPIWGDEAFIVMSLMSRDYAGLVQPLEHGQIAPLGFMWAERAAVQLLGCGELALRLLPWLTGIFSLGLYTWFARRVLDRRAAMLAVGIFAASYYIVRHGTEVKPYAGDLAVSLVLTVLGWAVCIQPRSPGRWIGLILAAAVGVWLSYPSVFIVAAIGSVLAVQTLRRRSRGELAALAAFGLLAVGSFLAMYLLYGKPHADSAAYMWKIDTWRQAWPFRPPWRFPIWLVEIHSGSMMAYPFGGKNGGSSLTLVLVIVGSVWLWRRGRKQLVALLLLPLAWMLLAAAMEKYPYGASARVALHMAPAFCLLAGAGASALLRKLESLPRTRPQGLPSAEAHDRLSRVGSEKPRGRHGHALVAILLGAIMAVAIIADVLAPSKTWADANARQCLRSVAASTGPVDRWIVYHAIGQARHAPNIIRYEGDGCRWRYYVYRSAPENLLFGPSPETVEPLTAGRTHLLVYRHFSIPLDEMQLKTYLEALSARLGRPERQEWMLHDQRDRNRDHKWPERMEVYTFPR